MCPRPGADPSLTRETSKGRWAEPGWEEAATAQAQPGWLLGFSTPRVSAGHLGSPRPGWPGPSQILWGLEKSTEGVLDSPTSGAS